ncbi:MAG TPA: 50S ribosomal protein L9 [Spirochaetota bacterium]|nr:50S ribosomal protein L9 [Spirochaetota bacterium]HNU90956.1 50S ribosomal protein L9 [Spirochaetota bacterium]HPI13302.1 50S ribosomal protein L9 [Spirochaetota bacterium]HPO44565.1 50S ribosomal protein L9 [Spirochaetota bacterium]HPV97307.1 50S ribosomal protein L9 [Spirochaetota bacterium]
MKVILQKDIPNLGEAGDIKEVSNGYARNYLLPRKLVLLASDSSRKAVEHQKKLIKIKKEKRKKQSETLMEALSALEIQIGAQVGEEEKLFGSVTSMDIARRLKELGHEVDRRKIHLDEPIKRLGEYRVPVKLDDGVTANIKVTVFKE